MEKNKVKIRFNIKEQMPQVKQSFVFFFSNSYKTIFMQLKKKPRKKYISASIIWYDTQCNCNETKVNNAEAMSSLQFEVNEMEKIERQKNDDSICERKKAVLLKKAIKPNWRADEFKWQSQPKHVTSSNILLYSVLFRPKQTTNLYDKKSSWGQCFHSTLTDFRSLL